jgi:hypothetical protein
MASIPQVTIAHGATWQEVAADRQKYRDATIAVIEPPIPQIKDCPANTIPLAKQFLTPEETTITETTVEELVWKLAKAELSAVVVAKAFLRRAALAQIAVRYELFTFVLQRLTYHRQIVLLNFSQSVPLNEHHISTHTSKRTVSPSVLYTVYRLV